MPERRPTIELTHPARLITVAFATVILIGTALLSLPIATAGDPPIDVLTAFFTATSAVCVTGLVVVDTSTYWSGFGQVVILALIQIGGLGIMAFGAVLAYTLSTRIGLRMRFAAQAEMKAAGAGDFRRLLRSLVAFVAASEVTLAVVLSVRFWWGTDEGVLRAIWLGVFHAISVFNNAGFALFEDSLTRFVDDVWITVPVMIGAIVGGIEFPVVLELRRNLRRPSAWSLHTKMTLLTTGALLAAGFVVFMALEWSNTLAPLDTGGRVLASAFQSVTPRTPGFHTLDYSAMNESTWLFTTALMFIGAGSASTAGGIKVTTFALLGFVVWSELRNRGDVTAFRRRIGSEAQRQAITVVLLSIALVGIASMVLITLDDLPLIQILFEVVSAFGLVGLSTGITGELGGFGRLVLIGLMFVGRIGPATMGVALVLREHRPRFRYAEDRPMIG